MTNVFIYIIASVSQFFFFSLRTDRKTDFIFHIESYLIKKTKHTYQAQCYKFIIYL